MLKAEQRNRGELLTKIKVFLPINEFNPFTLSLVYCVAQMLDVLH